MNNAPSRASGTPGNGQALFFPGLVPSRYSAIADYVTNDPFARRRFAEFSELLGYPLVEAYREAEIYDWEIYEAGHIAICLALADFAVERQGLQPGTVIGQSFGSFVAAMFSGVLSSEDMVLLVKESTRVELDYFENLPRPVGCLFLYRTTSEQLARLVREGADGTDDSWLEVSIDMDTTVHAVSGTLPELQRLENQVKESGGFPFYTMNRAEHCSRVAELCRRLDTEVYEKMEWRDAAVPMMSDVDGKLRWDGTEIREDLLNGWVTPVRWNTITDGLRSANIERVHILGPRNFFSRITDKYAITSVISPKAVMQFNSDNSHEAHGANGE
ncbi:hypothetical protein ACWFMI_08280 [Nocardiopsis terrae]